MFKRHETQQVRGADIQQGSGRGCKLWGLTLALALLPGLAQALPYHSFVEASACYTTYQGVGAEYDTASGSGVSAVGVETWRSPVVGPPLWPVTGGEAGAYSDPAIGVLKASAYGAYWFDDGDPSNEIPFSWEICWAGQCGPWSEPILPGSGARAYARSVWQVTSDVLPAGTPVSLTLNISLAGRLIGDPQEDGTASAYLRAWLNTPASLQAYVRMDPLDDAAYGSGIINWWRDLGPSPNLEISVSNVWVTGNYSESISSDALPPMVFFPPLPQVVVGDILILETELVAGTRLFNDGCCVYVTDDGLMPTSLLADFFNTGNVGITVNTPGVQLVPVPEPAAVWTMLAGLGVLILLNLGRRLCNNSMS